MRLPLECAGDRVQRNKEGAMNRARKVREKVRPSADGKSGWVNGKVRLAESRMKTQIQKCNNTRMQLRRL